MQRIHLWSQTLLLRSLWVSASLFVCPCKVRDKHSWFILNACLVSTCLVHENGAKNWPNKQNWLSSFPILYNFSWIYFFCPKLACDHHAISHLKLMHDVILWHQSVQTDHRISIFYILFWISISDEQSLVWFFGPIMRQYLALYKLTVFIAEINSTFDIYSFNTENIWIFESEQCKTLIVKEDPGEL